MTNAKVFQGFRDDGKVENHWIHCILAECSTAEKNRYGKTYTIIGGL